MNAKSNIDDKTRRILQYDKELGVLAKILLDKFSDREDCQVYRTVQSIPTTDNDQTPRALRNNNTGKSLNALPDNVIQAKPEPQQLKLAGRIGLSVNDSAEAAIDSCLKTYRTLKENGADTNDLAAYRENRGQYVIRLNVRNTESVMTDFVNHHANLFLYEGVDLEDIRDKTFEPITILYPES